MTARGKAISIPKCMKCGVETKELYEQTTEQGTLWLCKKCAPVGYKLYHGKELLE